VGKTFEVQPKTKRFEKKSLGYSEMEVLFRTFSLLILNFPHPKASPRTGTEGV